MLQSSNPQLFAISLEMVLERHHLERVVGRFQIVVHPSTGMNCPKQLPIEAIPIVREQGFEREEN
jgi:hypothetical protein